MAKRDPVPEFKLHQRGGLWYGRFQAMASPCEVLVETDDKRLARALTRKAAREALRIEHAFSRYRDDNVVHRINTSNGRPVKGTGLAMADCGRELPDGSRKAGRP